MMDDDPVYFPGPVDLSAIQSAMLDLLYRGEIVFTLEYRNGKSHYKPARVTFNSQYAPVEFVYVVSDNMPPIAREEAGGDG